LDQFFFAKPVHPIVEGPSRRLHRDIDISPRHWVLLVVYFQLVRNLDQKYSEDVTGRACLESPVVQEDVDHPANKAETR
jgi:hypothetical protein